MVSRFRDNEERERRSAEEAAWRERMDRFAPPSAMDRMIDLAMDCIDDLNKMEDGDDD